MEGNKGWRITLYSDEEQTIINNREELGFNHLSWSPYDRMQISIEDDFKHFIFPKPNTQFDWCGVKKQLHLIPMYLFSTQDKCNGVTEYRNEWIQGDENRGYLLEREDCSVSYGLYCLVTISLSDVVTQYISQTEKSSDIKNKTINDLMAQIKTAFDNTDENTQLDCIALESLGAEDFALIILANDIKVFFQVLSIVRNQHIGLDSNDNSENDLFKSIYTMTGFNYPKFECITNAKCFVKIHLRKDFETIRDTFYKIAKGKNVNVLNEMKLFEGKNTIGLMIQPTDFSLWHPNADTGVFNGTSFFYINNIISSRTYWIDEEKYNIKNKSIVIEGLTPTIYTRIDEELSKKRLKGERFQTDNPVGQFIYSEYDRLLSVSNCTGWIDFLKIQQNAFKGCTNYYRDSNHIAQENLLLEEMQTVLTHINQACSSISDVPYHNQYYSGSFSDILKMYYGLIEAIIEVGRNVPRTEENNQSPLAFGIKFESSNKIHTTLYSNPDQKYRIAIFHLPYEALHNFESNMELLVHEVFHYIAPIDRKFRNKSILNVWTECVIELLVEHLCENGSSVEIASEIRDYLNKNWSMLCEECYNNVNESISGFERIETNAFMDSSFAQEVLLLITQIILRHVQDYMTQRMEATDTKEEQNNYQAFSEKIEKYTIEYLMWRFISKNALLRFVELVVAIKEAFCDLFMCSVFDLSFERYLSFFGSPQYLSNLKQAELTVVYRINIVKYILETKYQKTAYDNREFKPWDSLENLDNLFATDESKKAYNKLKEDSANTLRNPQLYDALIKVLSNEINYLKEVRKAKIYPKIERLRDIHNTKLDYIENDISQKVTMIHKCMDSFFVFKNENNKEIELPTIEKASYSLTYDHSIWVYSITDYIQKMCDIVNESGEEQLWFRGVCNECFSLLPSLFRYLDGSLSLYANQVKILKRAYASTLQYPNLWNCSISEQMCCLQHYGMPTNLLDFSLDMLVALHFAINPDVEKDRMDLDKGIVTPAVYVFKPQEYASAVRSLQSGSPLDEKLIQYNVSPVLYDIAGDNMTGYFPNKMESSALIEHTRLHNNDYVPSSRVDNYPIPVIIRHSNSRVLVQNGTFLAYSLDSKPDQCSEKRYSYLDLKRVEFNYEDLLLTNGMHKRKFIEKIKINPCSISAIRKDLITLGISKSKMYPELQQIFAEEKKKL